MRIVSTIMKQEIIKVAKNKKMLFSIFVMPFLLVIMAFSLMSMQEGEGQEVEYYNVYLLNTTMQEQICEINEYKVRVVGNAATDYGNFIQNHDMKESEMAIEVNEEGYKIYYNSVNNVVNSLLPTVKSSIIQPIMDQTFFIQENRQIESFALITEDTCTEMAKQNRTVSFMLPYLLMIILYMNLVSIVGDSIAGEKERGTLSKQLLAPIDNSQMILGKLLGTTIVGAFSSVIYFIALLGAATFSEKLLGKGVNDLSGFSLHPQQVVVMLLGFMFIALVFVAAIVLMSSFAKTLKEATGLSMVIYYLIIVAALASAFNVGEADRIFYAIPIYNFSLFMQKLLINAANVWDGLITVGSLLVTFGILVLASVLNFRREKVING